MKDVRITLPKEYQHIGYRQYIARVRPLGAKKYSIVSVHRSKAAATRAMAHAFAADERLKRGDVLYHVWGSYYDPDQVCELVRR